VSPIDATIDPDDAPGAASTLSDEDAQVRQLMAGLPGREQNLLLLRYWIGMSHKEIAQALAQPEGTVRRQCSEALDLFRKRWGENDA